MPPSIMKGLLLTEFNKPYRFSTDIPVPKLETEDDVLVKIAVAGYCHTEMMVQSGEWADKITATGRSLPLIPSHEGVGTIVEVGANVKHLKVGDRVGSLTMQHSCGTCSDCKQGLPKFCDKNEMYGVSRDGAAAEYMVVDSKWTISLPSQLSFESAAPLMCAGTTIYSGLKVADLQPGQTVAIIGAGALGHIGIQFAKCMGLKVVCVDARQAPLDLVQKLKYAPDFALDATKGVDYALKTISGDVDATLMATDSLAAHEYGLQLTKKHGTFVIIGQPTDPIPIHYSHLIFRNLTIKGSLLTDPETLKEMVTLVAEKGIEVKTRSYPIQDVETLLQDYHKENHAGKLVLRVSDDQ
ncbi:hypothetical protein M422DRAFT_39670 [Sphaerobolus stellatus SS14]|uniref:Enoyl reductase (ER) domain-containing protein n=1 Tax=Sphaerobolus stellatus (strain SS14) TaxID=990650 RepID=A0A0C9U2M3_SPHS4|nr:hypothetical protein M422DRAFT_39670 [Sphaerobolus stellatus SS14]